MNTSEVHSSDELCNICEEKMGEHHPVTSLQMVCCTTGEWFHKRCLKEQASLLGDDFKCPKCLCVDEFKENMLSIGVFIPKIDSIAQYRSGEEDDDVENAQRWKNPQCAAMEESRLPTLELSLTILLFI